MIELQSYSECLAAGVEHAANRLAVLAVGRDGTESTLTRSELYAQATRCARVLAERGVGPGSRVVVAVAGGLAHVVCSTASWLLGACVLPLNPGAPAAERAAHLALFGPGVVIAEWNDAPNAISYDQLSEEAGDRSARPLPDARAGPGKAIGSGGSTGRPKLVVDSGPWGLTPALQMLLAGFGLIPEDVQLIPGPLYHNFGFDWCYYGLMLGHTVVVLERFDAELAVAAIERHRVSTAGFVPTMMRRIAALPDIKQRDLTSLRSILHSAGPCSPAVKRSWFDLIGPERVVEGYGATEGYGNTLIRGDEWLTHKGSVGRAFQCEIRILDDAGLPLPPGVVGEIYMRRDYVPADRHLGAQPRLTADGFGSVGDMGSLDADGYLYLADRRVDMIVTGGVNVYPAEVENALTEHPAIADAAVIGLPDEEWGRRVHAVVQLHPDTAPPTVEALTAHCRERLTAYKAPRSYEFAARLPRDDGGKLSRTALVADRRTPTAR